MWCGGACQIGTRSAWKSRGLLSCARTRTWPNSHKGTSEPPRGARATVRFRPSSPALEGLEDAQATLLQRTDQADLWRKAVKLPMYWVAVIPVLVGAGLVVLEGHVLDPGQVAALLLSSVLHLAWLNLSNDVFDSRTGVDLLKKESVVNLTGKPGLVLVVSVLALVVSTGIFVLAHANGVASGMMFALCVACGYVYQGPPFRLGYKGLGEPLCFLAFGPFSTLANYLAMVPCETTLANVSLTAWACSAAVGLTSAIVLFCSHFHQYDGDKLAGKLSPVVRLGGIEPATKVLQWVTYSPFLWLGIMALLGILPVGSFLGTTLLALSKAKDLNSFAFKYSSNPDILCRLKIVALKLHSAFGLMLSTSLMAAGLQI